MNPQNSRDALGQLQSFQSTRRKPQDVLRESEERLGIPTATQRQVGLRGAITNTENLLKNVDPSVSGRTQGSLVTDAQKQRLIALEREPIAGQFTEQSRALENETANVAELNRRALQESQLAVSADDARQNELQSLYQALYKQEQDQIAREQADRAFAEQQRQFNAGLKASGSGSNALASLLGQQAQSQPAQDDIKLQAQADVARLLTKDKARVQREYEAIRQSAGFGNTYDKMKLQLLESYGFRPGKQQPKPKEPEKKSSQWDILKGVLTR